MPDSIDKLVALTASLNSVYEEIDILFGTSQSLLCLVHEDGRLIQVSVSWERILGWTVHDLTSQTFFNFIHPDDIEKTRAAWESRTKQGKAVTNFTNRYRCQDGSYRTLLWNTPGMTANGTLYSSASDITDWVGRHE